MHELGFAAVTDLMCGLNSAEIRKGCMVVLWLDFFSLFSSLVCGFEGFGFLLFFFFLFFFL